MALTYTPETKIGTKCPDFQLPGVDGRLHSRNDYDNKKALLVMFICNHCPYVKAIEDRLISLGNEMKSKDVAIVAISSNDAREYPADSFEKMRERAEQKSYPFPYLYDETQKVAKAFGAVCTPDFFLYDSSLALAYRGRLDDSWKDAAFVRSQDLKSAIEALLRSEQPNRDQKPSMGCSIKWKETDRS